MSVSAAYAVQRERIGARPVAGYKVGLTSKAVQDLVGLKTPAAGLVTADSVHVSPARLERARFTRLGIEFEIAVRMARDLGADEDPAGAIGAACAAIELIDDGACNYAELSAERFIADNAWNVGIVLGDFVTAWPDLSAVEGRAFADDVEIGVGYGRDVLGGPLASVAWLARHLAEQGDILRAGAIVMTGSLMKVQFPARATRYRYAASGLGAVTCDIV
jgi:2-keto-4-pentenoate hydratase